MKDEQVVELMKEPLVCTAGVVQRIHGELQNPDPVLVGEACAKYQRLRIVSELKTRLDIVKKTLEKFGEAPPIDGLNPVCVIIRGRHETKKLLLEDLICLLDE